MIENGKDRVILIADTETVCPTCKHYAGGNSCEAFDPGGIPLEILSGSNRHKEPYPGDNGIQYERL